MGKSSDRHQEDPDGLEVVIHLLKRVKDPPKIDAETAKDPEALAEILVEHEHEIDGTRLMHALALLVLPLIDDLVHEYLVREYYLLDPNLLSEDVIARLYGDVVAGRRERPMRLWLRNLIERSARLSRTDPAMTYFPATSKHDSRNFMLHRICCIVNGMPHDVRRLAWLMWVEKKTYQQLEAETSAPLEKCEHIIAQIMMRAVRDHNRAMGWKKKPREPGADEFGGEEEEGANG